MKKCYVQHLDLFDFYLSSHMENYGQANFCTFVVANSILHNKRLKLTQLDLIQTHHVRSQAPIKASMYSRYILLAHLHETTVQKNLYFQEKLGTKKIHTSFSSLPFSVLQHGFIILILDVVILVTSVNLVHNALVELPPARSFPACAGPPLLALPRPVLHWALPSPTPQNTPQGTGANGITPER